jgi:hypothetical protein
LERCDTINLSSKSFNCIPSFNLEVVMLISGRTISWLGVTGDSAADLSWYSKALHERDRCSAAVMSRPPMRTGISKKADHALAAAIKGALSFTSHTKDVRTPIGGMLRHHLRNKHSRAMGERHPVGALLFHDTCRD